MSKEAKHKLYSLKRFILINDYPGNSKYYENRIYSSEHHVNSDIEFFERYPANFRPLAWWEQLTTEELLSIRKVVIIKPVKHNECEYKQSHIVMLHSIELCDFKDKKEPGFRFKLKLFDNSGIVVTPDIVFPYA